MDDERASGFVRHRGTSCGIQRSAANTHESRINLLEIERFAIMFVRRRGGDRVGRWNVDITAWLGCMPCRCFANQVTRPVSHGLAWARGVGGPAALSHGWYGISRSCSTGHRRSHRLVVMRSILDGSCIRVRWLCSSFFFFFFFFCGFSSRWYSDIALKLRMFDPSTIPVKTSYNC